MRTSPHLAVALGVIALAGATLGMGATPGMVVAASACQASYVVLGQTPAATGATPTDWFNVFGDNFDPSVPATLTVSAPVIPWSVEQPLSVQAPVTSYTMPAKYMAGGFKWTFRAQDGKIQEITVRITGKACDASTVVDFSPPGTSTVPDAPASRDQSSASLLILLVSIGGALAMLWRLHSERNRLSPPFPPEPTS
jgi:hypothetical protein